MGNVTDTHLDEMIRVRRRALAAGTPLALTVHVPCAGRLYPTTAFDLLPDFVHGLGRAAQVRVQRECSGSAVSRLHPRPRPRRAALS